MSSSQTPMDSDDNDAEEPPKKESLHRRAASFIKRAIKKGLSIDSGDIYENIEESEAENSNPFFIKSREDDSVLPSISELMEKAYLANPWTPVGDDYRNFVLESLQKILLEKSAQDKSVAKETDMKSEDVVRPPLLANLEVDSMLHLASYNEALFPTHHKEDPTLTGAGLRNLGNTCFMNSVLQCLVHTVPLYEAILSENHSLTCNCKSARLKGICLPCYIRHICRSSTSGRSVIAPMGLAYSLKYIADRFKKGQQDDAHEFLIMLWNRLMESHAEGSPSDSLMKRVFGGLAFVRLTCCGCKNTSGRTEEIYDMQLPIQHTGSLVEAIVSHTIGKVSYRCEKCGKKESAMQKMMYRQVPSIATFQLKRFDNEMNKIAAHVFFPLVLDLTPFTVACDAEIMYELYAVIVHRGSKLKEGHYYCFIQISPDQWIRFDDDKVLRVHEDEVLAQEAYILFYAKQGTAWFTDAIKVQETKNGATETEASLSFANPSTSSQEPASADPSCSSREEVTEINNGKGGGVDASGSSGTPAGRYGLHLAPIVEEREEESELEDVEALTRAGR